MSQSSKTGSTLVHLADLDRQVLQLNKQINELPQRQQITELNAQKQDVLGKVKQLEQLRNKVAQKTKALADRKVSLEDKIASNQAKISNGNADYREVASLSKKLEELAAQLQEIAEERAVLDEQEFKLVEVQEQADRSLSQLKTREQKIKDSLMADGGALIAERQKLGDERQQLLELLSPHIVTIYEQKRSENAGVGAAGLQGNTCGGCHIGLSDGQIDQIKLIEGSDDIGECPLCHRLLVLQ
jgi:predicted  nucleic acid-binding Zn-ribbon protein